MPRRALLVLIAALCSCASPTGAGRQRQVITTVVGAESIADPSGLAIDRDGRLFVADGQGNRVVRVDSKGKAVTVAGTGEAGFLGDGGPALAAELSDPRGLAFDAAGNLYIADSQNNRIRRVDRGGRITTVAGDGRRGFTGDGVRATETALSSPSAVVIDKAGDLLIADTDNGRIRRVNAQQAIATVAGGGTTAVLDAAQRADSVSLGRPTSIALDRAGVLIASIPAANQVIRVDASGMLRAFLGNRQDHPVEDYDGPAGDASLETPASVATDGKGNLFVSEGGTQRVRRVDGTGTMRTVAAGDAPSGLDVAALGAATPANAAGLGTPGAVAARSSGDLYVADPKQGGVRKVSRTGAAGYSRLPVPVVTSTSPTSGGAGGQTFVRIRGSGFSTLTTEVRFGTSAARVLNVTPTEIDVESPPGRDGRVDVDVRTGAGRATHGPATKFTYVPGWQLAAAMGTPRYLHTATVLDPPFCRSSPPADYPCGEVLIVGGAQTFCFGCPALVSAERYDAVADAWRTVAPMSTGRMEHTATLLGDGRVLVAGGRQPNTDPRYLGSHVTLNSAEIYDPVADRWTPATPMQAARLGATATLLDGPPCRAAAPPADCGQVLMVGGALRNASGPGANPRPTELYDPRRDAWTLPAQLDQSPSNHAATVLPDGRVLITGGIKPLGNVSSDSTIYDPSTGVWTPTPGHLAVARYAHTATLLPDGRVLAVEGAASPLQYLRSAELFDPRTGMWTPAGLPSEARAGHTAALLSGGRVLVSGGGPPMFDVYDTAANGSGPIGHSRPDSQSSAEIFDPSSNRWSTTRPLNVARAAATAIVVDGPACGRAGAPPACGAVVVIGGGGTNFDPQADASLIPIGQSEVYP